jgi:hypothetical protein
MGTNFFSSSIMFPYKGIYFFAQGLKDITLECNNRNFRRPGLVMVDHEQRGGIVSYYLVCDCCSRIVSSNTRLG